MESGKNGRASGWERRGTDIEEHWSAAMAVIAASDITAAWVVAAMLAAWLVAGALQLRTAVPALPAAYCLAAGGRFSGAANQFPHRAGGGEHDLAGAVRVVAVSLVGAAALAASLVLLARGHSAEGGPVNLAVAWLVLSLVAVVATWAALPSRTGAGSATRDWLARRGPQLVLPTLGGEVLIAAATAWAAVAMAHTAGASISPFEAAAAAVVARSLTLLPLPPWGLGIADAALVLSLVAIGAPASAALATAVLWRGAMVVAWVVSRRAGPLPAAADVPLPTGSRLGGWFHRQAFRAMSILPAPLASRARRCVFETLFRTASDPWQYDAMPYEVVKRQRLVDAVPASARTIVEFGCADGHNLLAIANRFPGARIVGLDISPLAVQTARERTAACGNISVLVADAGTASARLEALGVHAADAMVVAEVLYYLGSPGHVSREMAALAGLLTPGGSLVLVHPVADADHLHPAAAGALGIESLRRRTFDDPQRPYAIDTGVRPPAPVDCPSA